MASFFLGYQSDERYLYISRILCDVVLLILSVTVGKEVIFPAGILNIHRFYVTESLKNWLRRLPENMPILIISFPHITVLYLCRGAALARRRPRPRRLRRAVRLCVPPGRAPPRGPLALRGRRRLPPAARAAAVPPSLGLGRRRLQYVGLKRNQCRMMDSKFKFSTDVFLT